MAPYNALMYLFSAVPNKPIVPVSTIPDLAKLRDRGWNPRYPSFDAAMEQSILPSFGLGRP